MMLGQLELIYTESDRRPLRQDSSAPPSLQVVNPLEVNAALHGLTRSWSLWNITDTGIHLEEIAWGVMVDSDYHPLLLLNVLQCYGLQLE